jgi:hypothetical protein
MAFGFAHHFAYVELHEQRVDRDSCVQQADRRYQDGVDNKSRERRGEANGKHLMNIFWT